jgi:hypothetical protein
VHYVCEKLGFHPFLKKSGGEITQNRMSIRFRPVHLPRVSIPVQTPIYRYLAQPATPIKNNQTARISNILPLQFGKL